jgi:hypothetical protein
MASVRDRIRDTFRSGEETNGDRRDDERVRDRDDERVRDRRGDERVRGRRRDYADRPRRDYDDEVVERRRDRFGGINWGAAFFGWITAVGIGALLTALLSAAGAAIGLTDLTDEAGSPETVSIIGAALLLAVALISYFAGGYVAGRMSRFDGARQGLATWLWALIAVIVLAIIGAIAGSEYNLFSDIDLPRIPVDEGELSVGGAITLILIAVGTLLAAMAGGKAGQRYHARVDRVGYERD